MEQETWAWGRIKACFPAAMAATAGQVHEEAGALDHTTQPWPTPGLLPLAGNTLPQASGACLAS